MNLERIKEAIDAPAPEPLYSKLSQAIREQIMDGTLQAGEALPPEREMRQYIGLSRGTIRQAITQLIQNGFLKSVPGTGTFVLDYEPRRTASGLIGMITSTPHFSSFYPQLATRFNERLRQTGYGMVMALHNEKAEALDEMVREMLAQQIVGLAITPPRHGDISGPLERLRQRGIPVVGITRHRPELHIDTVATDNRQIGLTATRHLLDYGHRHVLHIGLTDYSTGSDRASGYQQAMMEAGLDTHIIHIQEIAPPRGAGLHEAPIYPAAQVVEEVWGGEGPYPTAIFCFNDTIALGVYKALRDMGLAIPEDVSLVSVDDLLMIKHFETPLTTFKLPSEAIGNMGAEMLMRRLNGDTSPPAHMLLQAEFIERASVAEPL